MIHELEVMEKCLDLLSTLEKEKEIELGEFTIARDAEGYLWLYKQDGEAMQLSPETEAKLIALLEKFWKEEF